MKNLLPIALLMLSAGSFAQDKGQGEKAPTQVPP
jgi:hypothetical protein